MVANDLCTTESKRRLIPGGVFIFGSVGRVERSETHPIDRLRPLAETRAHVRKITRPILGIDSKPHHPVERRMRPIPDPRYKAMLDRIDMDVLDVPCQIVLITNRVLPITSLPDPALALGGAAGRNGLANGKVA
jgi:hypothetical protein